MKRWLYPALILFVAGVTAARATADGVTTKEHNRISAARPPAYVVSLQVDGDIAGGETRGELWRAVFRPVLAAEVSLFNLILLGVSLPFAVEAGYPFYGAPSLDLTAGSPRLDLGIAGRYGAVSFRGSAHFVIPGISGPAAGASISVASIRDPVALKLSLHVGIGHENLTRRWGFENGGCSVAMLLVLNDMVSVELGTGVDIRRLGAMASPPPSFAGRAGIYVQTQRFASFFFVSRELWDPFNPALFSTGIAFSWGLE